MSIPYATRISARARHPQIRINPPDQVEVVIPRGMPLSIATNLVAAKRTWIERKLAQLARIPRDGDTATHPEAVELVAIDRRLPVRYRASKAVGVRVGQDEDGLLLTGEIGDALRVRSALRRWLLAHAKTALPPMLQDLASAHGFGIRQIGVRLQKGRWGSCSARGHISLNAALLCLPVDLARHVMLHELAHLEHLNHSRAFWTLLRGLDPDADRHHAALRTAWARLPAWLARSGVQV